MHCPPEAFVEALRIFSRHERMDPLMLLCKLTEESGELAEAVLVERGYKPHKTLPEGAALDEAADVMLCLLLLLTRLYPDRAPETLAAQLAESVGRKVDRYIARQPAAPAER